MPPTSLKTRPATRKLSEVAKHLAVPTEIVSSEWPSVRKTCVQKLGIAFDDWQDETGRLILAKRADGHLAAMIDGVGISIPRQVGKTYTIAGLVFGLCVNKPGLLVIWSAHHARTHTETFLSMQAFAKRAKVAPHIAQVFTGSGTEEIRFHNTSRILFGARERGFGRGIPGVDVLVSDEAQILSDKAMANMIATMNTSQFGLALFMGTPPRPDDMSDGFTRMRVEALAGRMKDGAWIEFGAPDDADPNDRKQWAKANPSYPKRTPAQSILRMKRKLTPEDFLREGMGVWDDPEQDVQQDIDMAAWGKCKDTGSEITGQIAFGVAVTYERSHSAIGVAGLTAEGLPQLEIAAHHRGTSWLVERARELQAKWGRHPFAFDGRGPAASLIPDFQAAGFEVLIMSAADMAVACGQMFDAITGTQTVRHLGDPDLDAAVGNTSKRPVGDRFMWGRKNLADITCFEAVTCASHGLTVQPAPLTDVGVYRF